MQINHIAKFRTLVVKNVYRRGLKISGRIMDMNLLRAGRKGIARSKPISRFRVQRSR